jgi:CRP/FNR family transcriptional regulator
VTLPLRLERPAPADEEFAIVGLPRQDALFERIVTRYIRAVRAGRDTIRAARRSLRLRYPEAELSRQQDVMVRGASVEVWFAYRDGRAEPATSSNPWWDEKRLARIVVDRSGRLSRPNERSRLLLGLEGGNGRPARLENFVSPGLCEELGAASEWLWRRGETLSTLPLRLSSGRWLDVDFRATRDSAREAYQVALRSFADRDQWNDRVALRESSIGVAPPAIQRELINGSRRRKMGPGEQLPTSLIDDFWAVLVTAGIVRLYVTINGYEPTLLYGTSGSLLGTHTQVPMQPLVVGLQSVTPSVILHLNGRRVAQLARSNAAFGRAVADDLQAQLQEVVRSFAARSAEKLANRLAREIVLISDLQSGNDFVAVTQQQLADGVGSMRESVGRTIGDLRSQGLVATTRHGILILDRPSLRRAAQADL